MSTEAVLTLLDDSELISYCSTHADGDVHIHLLCDRLTRANMKLTAAQEQMRQTLETLQCEKQ